MQKHDTSSETAEIRPDGEHGKRDQVNDARNKAGQFARKHHDPADTVGQAIKDLERQAAKEAEIIDRECADRGMTPAVLDTAPDMIGSIDNRSGDPMAMDDANVVVDVAEGGQFPAE